MATGRFDYRGFCCLFTPGGANPAQKWLGRFSAAVSPCGVVKAAKIRRGLRKSAAFRENPPWVREIPPGVREDLPRSAESPPEAPEIRQRHWGGLSLSTEELEIGLGRGQSEPGRGWAVRESGPPLPSTASRAARRRSPDRRGRPVAGSGRILRCGRSAASSVALSGVVPGRRR